MAQAITFKYRYLDPEGNLTGLFSRRGSFDGENLILDKQTITIMAILRAMRRFNHLMIIFHGDTDEPVALTLVISSGDIARLHSSLNMIASESLARRHLHFLELEGRGETFRVETCPHCQATIDLTGFSPSAQVHCQFCDIIGTLSEHPPEDEIKAAHCDRCELFALPKEFTVFFFYYLIVHFGSSHRQIYVCKACMRREVWKMFFRNLLFVVGIPISLVQIFWAYFGQRSLSPTFAGLEEANALYARGRYDDACQIYQQISDGVSCCAGVRFNHGLVHAAADRIPQATTQFELALRDCANYARAADALYGCYQRLGREDDADAIRRLWSDDSEGTPHALETSDDSQGSQSSNGPNEPTQPSNGHVD